MTTIRQPQLSRNERVALLAIARDSVMQALGLPALATEGCTLVSGRFGGVFVTLWNDRRLRGCIGSFAPTAYLSARVAEVARSVLSDPRFRDNPVTASEVEALTFEVSVLSGLTPTDDPSSLVPGVNGVLIRQGGRSGCFLPKVAADHGWSAEEFLEQCCVQKAGLPPDAWRDPSCSVSLFTVDSFRDKV